MNGESLRLKVGDWVEVRSKEEILRTLDKNAQLDGMPFMPEMFAFCGKRFQVYKSAHKTCDTVFPIRGRRVDRAVHLDTRCDGAAHGGCQATCLIFWKDAWLKSVDAPVLNAIPSSQFHSANSHETFSSLQCVESEVWARTRAVDENDEPIYSCQATQLPYATRDLDWWEIRQYVEDLRSGNVTPWQLICGAAYALYHGLSVAGIGVGRPMRWLYDKLYPLWNGTPFPDRAGTIPAGQPTPNSILNLQPGEFVRVKSHKEILKTLDTHCKNRGMYFGAEEVPYCGGAYRVQKVVARIIDDRNGKMLEFKSPSVILDSAICQGRFSECRMFCPRSIYTFWREVWLERVVPASSGHHSEQHSVPAQQSESEMVSGR